MTLSAHDIADLHRRARRALADGRAREAHEHCLKILQSDRRHAGAWFLCGVIAGENGQSGKAVEILQNAVRLDTQRADYVAELGKYLLARGKPREALEAAQHALSLSPGDIPTLNTLGTLLSHCGEHGSAIGCFGAAVGKLEDSNSRTSLSAAYRADLYFNMAASLQFAGRFEKAASAYETTIDLQPHYFKAHSALSALRRQTREQNHLQRLGALRNEVRSSADQLHVGHALAKEHEDLGEYDAALEALSWAKARRIEETGYRFARDRQLFDCVRQQFTPELVRTAAPGACTSTEPIFIVGMPRTGTTLAEQIVGSHSRVFAAGELQNFPLLVKELGDSTTADTLDTDTLRRAGAIDAAALGKAYLDSTRPRTGHTPHFIDKLPLNFLYLGLIRRALPNARLVCLRRDPMDTCLSNYRQLFATRFRHYYYGYDLLDCGRYYIEFDRLMSHWHQCMPGAIFELQYEHLVQQPETAARALLDFCGLPWEERCLEFSSRPASVATPSAVQVRQKIYTSSVQRWRKFGDAMQPLYALLQGAGYYP